MMVIERLMREINSFSSGLVTRPHEHSLQHETLACVSTLSLSVHVSTNLAFYFLDPGLRQSLAFLTFSSSLSSVVPAAQLAHFDTAPSSIEFP